MPRGRFAKSLVGHRFGRLLVIVRAGTNRSNATWNCRCDCGTSTTVIGSKLKSGWTRSCGCLKGFKHGHSPVGRPSPTYKSWHAMLQRTSNPKHKHFWNYGGNGIRVCRRWKDFRNFLSDMGKRPKNKTLDRVNNYGNYEPKNCRWATRNQQQLNMPVSQ